jgi:small subunit ribosomal protein S3Ae
MPKRTKAGKLKDKWREKTWLVVEAPPSFGGTQVGYIPVGTSEKAIGRVIETTLYDIIKQDPQHYVIKLHFQVTSVAGGVAKSILKAFEYSREYLRSLIRRGSSTISFIKDYSTKDKVLMRVYVLMLAQKRLNSSRKHVLRMVADTIVNDKSLNMTYDQFAQEAVLGKVAADIYNEAKKITQLRHVGVRKVKIVKGVPEAGPPLPLLPSSTEEATEEEPDQEIVEEKDVADDLAAEEETETSKEPEEASES